MHELIHALSQSRGMLPDPPCALWEGRGESAGEGEGEQRQDGKEKRLDTTEAETKSVRERGRVQGKAGRGMETKHPPAPSPPSGTSPFAPSPPPSRSWCHPPLSLTFPLHFLSQFAVSLSLSFSPPPPPAGLSRLSLSLPLPLPLCLCLCLSVFQGFCGLFLGKTRVARHCDPGKGRKWGERATESKSESE